MEITESVEAVAAVAAGSDFISGAICSAEAVAVWGSLTGVVSSGAGARFSSGWAKFEGAATGSAGAGSGSEAVAASELEVVAIGSLVLVFAAFTSAGASEMEELLADAVSAPTDPALVA